MSEECQTSATDTAALLKDVRPEVFSADYVDGGTLFVERLTDQESARRVARLSGSGHTQYVLIAMYDLPDSEDDEEARRVDKVMVDRNWRSLDRAIAALQAARQVRD